MKKPKLSIIIPAYNAAQYISKAIESVLKQTFTDFELIIINDGSSDNSKEIIHTFNDERIKYFENDSNKGIVFTRNRGVEKATGAFVGMLDADDIAYPDKFKKQIDFLEKNKDFGMVGSWVKFIDDKGNKLPDKWKLNAKPETIPAILLFKNYFLQSAVLYRKECLNDYSFTKGFDILEDYLIWYQIAKKYKVWNLPEYLVDYRIHNNSVTKKYNHERKEKEKKVFNTILNDIGINPTKKELNLHLKIREGGKISNINELKDIETWLLKILQENCKRKLYRPQTLTKVVINRWLKACKNVKPFNPQTIKICIFSKIIKTYFSKCKP